MTADVTTLTPEEVGRRRFDFRCAGCGTAREGVEPAAVLTLVDEHGGCGGVKTIRPGGAP